MGGLEADNCRCAPRAVVTVRLGMRRDGGSYGHARAIAAPIAVLCGLVLASTLQAAQGGGDAPRPSERQLQGEAVDGRGTPSVAPDDCAPGALPETGLQGQVPLADQLSGRSKQGYRCNVELVGQNDIRGRGVNFQMAAYRDCAYVGTSNQILQAPGTPDERDHPLAGMAVIDAGNPRDPELVRFLKSPVGQHQHEAIEVNERRGMLVAQVGGLEAQWIEVYDISEDCRNPRFVSRYDSGEPQYHGLAISADGRTIYASNTFPDLPTREALHVIDVSDMTKPRLLTTWDPTEELPPNEYGVHDLTINEAGDRAYLGATQQLGTLPNPQTPTVVVLDTSDIQQRVANPDLEVLGVARSQNFGHAVMQATIRGRPYLVSGGELPLNGPQYCPWAWGNLIDISDEAQPTITSTLQLEVNELANCPQTIQDQAGYSIHYGGVDDPDDTEKVFFTWYMSGLRIFDVRDPADPREIGYYISPPKEDTVFEPAFPSTGVDQNPRWDQSTSVVRYRPETGHIWFVSIANGFQIAKLTGTAASNDEAAAQPQSDPEVRPEPDGGGPERKQPRSAPSPSGSVGSGAVADGGGNLPFTGLQLGLLVLVATLLTGGGFALRRLSD